MAEVRFEVPDEAIELVAPTPADFARSLRFAAASTWYQQGDVTMSTAAAIAGMDLRDFLTALAEHGQDMITMRESRPFERTLPGDASRQEVSARRPRTSPSAIRSQGPIRMLLRHHLKIKPKPR